MPVTVVEHVMIKPTGAANYAVSRQGTLFYVPGGVSAQTTPLARVGRPEGARGTDQRAAARLRYPAHIARRHARGGQHLVDQRNTDIWIWDLARRTLRRLTFAPGTMDCRSGRPTAGGSSSRRTARAW